MKKNLVLILALALVLTLAIPSASFANLADYDVDLENAIIKAKEVFDITEDYDKFDYSVNTYNNRTEFNLNWSESNNKLGNIRVTIDSTGRIRNYYSYTPYHGDYKPRLAKVSKNEGKLIADEFIQKVDSGYLSNIEYVDNDAPLSVNDRYYYITYTRKENGILFPSNNIRVTVDNMTGEVRNFYANWDTDLEFPSPEGIISLNEAQEAYVEKIGLQLAYKFKFIDNETIPYLVYTNLTNKNSIDAKTGEVLENSGYYYTKEMQNEVAMDSGARGSSLTPAEQDAVDNIKDLLSQEDAEKLVREQLNIGEDLQLSYINLYSHWRDAGVFTWSMGFQNVEEKELGSVSASIDAKTGEITSFYKSTKFDENAVAKYNKDASKILAQNFIQKLQPEKYKEVEYVTWNEYDVKPLAGEELPRQYSFYFARKVNGAYVSNNGFNVTVDTVTGEITNYSLAWFAGELPLPDTTISLEEANTILFEDIGIELQYTVYYNRNNDIRHPEGINDNREIKLAYTINNDKPLIIDAVVGHILNHNGDIYQEKKVAEYTDIAGSYAKTQIEVLAQYGISLPGDKFNPTSEINQREFLYLVAKANDYYFSDPFSDSSEFDEKLYSTLINAGIVTEEEKAPLAQVKKEEAVKFIIRALKYDKVASIPGIYLISFKDADEITPELKGHIAIASGLGIISGYDGYFKPTSKLTREQAAMVIYNYLNSNS